MEEEGHELAMTQPREAFSVFPEGVTKHILGYLYNEALLASRVVCSDWRRIVDENYEGNIWKPYFARHRIADVSSQFRFTEPGTRFSSAEEVEQFMENHSGDQDPFINHTLVLNSRRGPGHKRLCQVFPRLVARFGGFVRHFVYYVNERVPESLHYISIIFQMTNLRSLTIFCIDWSRELIRNHLSIYNNAFRPLRDFQSLTVLGGNSDILLQRMSPSYGPQIKRLRYWHHDKLEHQECEPQFATYPNLEEIKVCGLSRQGIERLTRNCWPLKRLSIKMSDSSSINFGNVLESISVFAGTLESFHLQGAEENLLDRHGLPNREMRFPNVTDLRVPYFFQRQYVLNAMSMIFFNMKHLHLVDREGGVRMMLDFDENRIEVIGEILEPLWETLPAPLEMITVRYRDHDEVARRSIIHKYFQKRPD